MLLTECPTKITSRRSSAWQTSSTSLRVAVERRVALGIVRGEIGLARADVVEQDDPVVVLERGRDEAPHVLVAAEAVREEHGLGAAAEDLHVVAVQNRCIDRIQPQAHWRRRASRNTLAKLTSDCPTRRHFAGELWRFVEARRGATSPRTRISSTGPRSSTRHQCAAGCP